MKNSCIGLCAGTYALKGLLLPSEVDLHTYYNYFPQTSHSNSSDNLYIC